MKKRPLLIISGPTACAKTATSIHLAKLFKDASPRIINFDSLLFYRELNIGTAKPSQQERAGIAHELIDIRSITEPLNAADFTTMALELLMQVFKRQEFPILVGGSGFYLRALIKGMYDSPDVSEEVRSESAKLYEAHGIEPFISILKIHDPQRMDKLHPNDHYRIRRAWEHWKMTGKPVSAQGQEYAGGDPYDFSQHRLENWSPLHIHLDIPRNEHAEIIAARSAQMLQDGLVGEVQALLKQGYSGNEKPLQSIGYKEILCYLRHELDPSELTERINGATRRLAKQQRTFFAKVQPKSVYHPVLDVAKIERDVIQWLQGATL